MLCVLKMLKYITSLDDFDMIKIVNIGYGEFSMNIGIYDRGKLIPIIFDTEKINIKKVEIDHKDCILSIDMNMNQKKCMNVFYKIKNLKKYIASKKGCMHRDTNIVDSPDNFNFKVEIHNRGT